MIKHSILTGTIAFSALLLETSPATAGQAAITTKEIKYDTKDGKHFVGFLASPKDAAKKKLPGVLVVHEWWGQTDYPRTRARMLAELGYVALAVDMYGDRKTAEHPKDAGAFAGAVMSDAANVQGRLDAALAVLKQEGTVDMGKVGAIGYCFGGSVVLDAAKQGLPLKGVVSFHGGLETPTKAKAGAIHSKMLVLTGGDDKMIPASEVAAFSQEIKDAGGDLQVVTYPGAMHGFTNPDATELGKKTGVAVAYNEAADKASWLKMKEFFADLFK